MALKEIEIMQTNVDLYTQGETQDLPPQKDPLEITSVEMLEALDALDTPEDTPEYKRIRRALRRFIGVMHPYHTLQSMSKMLGLPPSLLTKLLTPAQMANMGSKTPPVHLIVTREDTPKDSDGLH